MMTPADRVALHNGGKHRKIPDPLCVLCDDGKRARCRVCGVADGRARGAYDGSYVHPECLTRRPELKAINCDVLPPRSAIEVAYDAENPRVVIVRGNRLDPVDDVKIQSGPPRFYEIPDDGELFVKWSDLWEET